MSSKYGRGYIPDPAGHMRTSFAAHPASQATFTPPSAGPIAFAPPKKDQGQMSGCTGHGTSTGISTTFRAAGNPLPWEPSEDGIYKGGRAIDRVRNPDGTFPPLEDGGAMPNQVMRAVSEYGIRPSRAPAPDGRNSDCTPKTINDEPTLADLEVEALFVPIGEYAIYSKGAARVLAVRQALAANLAVCFGTFVDTAFENWNPADGTPVGAPDTSDPNGGGHWMVALQYRTDSAGKTIVRCRNSWGDWGMDGDFEGDEDFINAWDSIVVMAVRKK